MKTIHGFIFLKIIDFDGEGFLLSGVVKLIVFAIL